MSKPTPLHGWAEDVLAMIADALEAIGCRHPNASHKDTPPMMYDDWIKCAVGRREDTIDAQATEIAALKGALEAKEREMLAEHSSAMQALLRWCAEDTPEDIRKGWEQESHEALRALAAGRPR